MSEQKQDDKKQDAEMIKPLKERLERVEKHLGINQPEKKVENTASARKRH